MKKPMWDSKAVKAYETGQGVELVNEPYPHYIPKTKGEEHMTEEDEEFERIEKMQNQKYAREKIYVIAGWYLPEELKKIIQDFEERKDD